MIEATDGPPILTNVSSSTRARFLNERLRFRFEGKARGCQENLHSKIGCATLQSPLPELPMPDPPELP
jgi:hypothetical protein